MKKYFLKYYSIIAFSILFFLIELFGTLLVDRKFWIYDLRYILTFLLIINTILFIIKNDKARFITAILLLLVQGSFNFFFIIMYEMTGQHFDYSMFLLRNDAVGIIENIPLDFFTSFIFFTSMSLLYVFGNRFNNRVIDENVKEPFKLKVKVVIASLLFFIGLSGNFLTAKSILDVKTDIYQEMLTGTSASKYNQFGITSNFVNELYSGLLYNEKMKLDEDVVLQNLYSNTNVKSPYFGVSEGNNVVTILGETLEWFAFINDSTLYPYGIQLSEAQLRQLYPNFYEFMDGSVILDNYHAREKTDVSEMYTLMGSYPKDTYINYEHADNNIPYSFANILEITQGVTNKNTFHNGTNTFYNRHIIHETLGFNHYYSSEELVTIKPDIFTDYISDGQRNLDSELFEASKEIMFPNNERFYSYALTITMHGRFDKRENLAPYYERLLDFGIDIDEFGANSIEAAFVTYLAAALDFDKALGVMFDYLKDNNLLENTTIVLFSDHNAYYQGLSSYVKDIYTTKEAEKENRNYMELYRVPAMIYDAKLVNSVDNSNQSRVITKYTSSSDIIPTLLDILGINYHSNMYYGNNIFSDIESLSYSRSYDVFFNDKIYFKNLNNIMFYHSDETNEMLKEKELEDYITYIIEPKATNLVNKIRNMDQLYYFDLLSSEKRYNDYVNRLKNLNGLN